MLSMERALALQKIPAFLVVRYGERSDSQYAELSIPVG